MITRTIVHEQLPKRLRILVSPAQCTQMTAHSLGLAFKAEPRISVGADVADVLAAAEWPDNAGATLIVGHQPTLGRVAALLISGEEANWTVKRASLWWFSNRTRGDETQTVLRAVIDPSFMRGRS
jgi:phosphohistidine phosphatase